MNDSADQALTRSPPTRAQLKAWLRALPPRRKFGTNSGDCVIAVYTGRATGFMFCGDEIMSPWLTKFITEFCEGRSHTVRAALRILEKGRPKTGT